MSEIIEEQRKINPQIMEIEIGIREMRKIKIYPLSMSDQLGLTNMISTAIAAHVAHSVKCALGYCQSFSWCVQIGFSQKYSAAKCVQHNKET